MGFQSPQMWVWGIAVVIPVILHFLHRSRARQMNWAAMQFIERAMAQTQSKLRLNQWLRLLVRMTVILLIVVALADPRSSGSSQSMNSEDARVYRILVIDDSFSMSAIQQNQTSLDLAVQKATAVVRAGSEGDGTSLVLLSDLPEVVIGSPAFDRDDVIAELAAVEQAHGSAQLLPCLETILEMTSSERLDRFGFERIEIVFISDGDYSLWSQTESAASKRLLDDLGKRASLRVYTVGEILVDNLAITDLGGLSDAGGVGNLSRFSATVVSYSDDIANDVQVSWRLDGKLLEKQTISLQPGATRLLQIQLGDAAEGSHILECHIDGDRMPVDNHRWIAFDTRSAIRVLLVEGSQSNAELLQLVFDPEFPMGRQVMTRRVDKTEFSEVDIASFDAVVLCDVPSFDRGDITRISDFLHRGGTLFIFAGSSANIENYNQWTWESPFRMGLIPGELGIPFDLLDESIIIAESDHPILELFDDDLLLSLKQLPITTARSFVPGNDVGKSILKLPGGESIYTEFKAGAGSAFVMTTDVSADSNWSEIVTWPVFLPLIHESLNYSMRMLDQARNYSVGDSVLRVVSVPTRNARLELTLPNEQQRSATLEPFQESSSWEFDETNLSGVYLVEYDEPINKQEQFVVNVVTAESKLRPYDQDLEVAGLRLEDDVELSIVSIQSSSEWYRVLLCIVVVVLFGEWYRRPNSQPLRGA